MAAMSPVDHAWYRMDSPENLMMVHAIMWTDQPLDWETLRAELGAGMLELFPKFRQHPVPPTIPFGRAGWEEDPDFDVERHIVHHRLPEPGIAALEEYIATQIPRRLDPEHPMWEVHLIDGFGSGSACLPHAPQHRRRHHADPGPAVADQHEQRTRRLHPAGDGSRPGRPSRRLDPDAGRTRLGLVRHPSRLLSTSIITVRGVRRLAHLATIPPKPLSALAGEIGTTKHVTWTDPLPLPQIKAISRAAGVTVNDVLLSLLADALGRYLTEEGTPLDSVRVMVPVNLRALDQPLTSDLGNVFGEYVVTLPTGAMGPAERLVRMHEIIEELKDSPEAVVAYLTLVAIGLMPDPVEDLDATVLREGRGHGQQRAGAAGAGQPRWCSR